MAEDYVIRVKTSPLEVDAAAWDALLQTQPNPSPFMRHAYLAALHSSGSANAKTGWKPHFFTLYQADALVAACAIYEKAHSYGEYVFDWAWANAYAQHGLPYYPKAVAAVPFTPVPGARLMARSPEARTALLQTLLRWCEQSGMSSLHLLFVDEAEGAACEQAGLMLRHTVQFHWTNTDHGYADFDAFLQSLSQEKRKKIRQERRKVAEAGVTFRWSLGRDITQADWDFFYRCYERTYLEHGNAPYLNRDFFQRMADTMPDNWLLFTAERNGHPIATSLIALDTYSTRASNQNAQEDWAAVCSAQVKEEPAKRAGDTEQNALPPSLRSENEKVAYGRYWGALERVDCLHFEACYYQPLQWCIEHGYQRFEGGAQGEHKMARALLPVKTTSAHWLAHPAFADAVARFLEREDQGISNYLDDLTQRSPFRQNPQER
ncbi:MAG: GNAT family N-acetyltransferase [Rhodoferax sp.]|nr:GNAT family N-acetyltransferase [Rhodoferax sp.]